MQQVEDRTKLLSEMLLALEISKEELNEALQTEKELSGLKLRFVLMVSHEFRTPLSIILSSAYLSEKYNLIDESAKRKLIVNAATTGDFFSYMPLLQDANYEEIILAKPAHCHTAEASLV